jgi:prepilin-type N-terminal cleavage/methylation domain-containing protein
MRMKNKDKNQQGFTLIEVLVSVTILSLVGLMAWRGMDAMIKGNEVIEKRRDADSTYLKLIKQFDKDCSEIPSADQLGFSPIAYSQNELLILRKAKINGQTSWVLVAYKVSSEGFNRQVFLNISDLSEIKNILAMASKKSNIDFPNSEISMSITDINQQTFVLLPDSQNRSINSARGIQVQWFVKNTKDPMTRSCLIGQGI